MPSTPDPVQYDSFAAEYEEHAAAAPYNALYDRPATLRLVGDVKGRRVLDAACDPGFYVEELLARRADVVGCDAQLTEEFSAAGSVMKRLIEPTPEPEMARSDPRTFEKLSREPASSTSGSGSQGRTSP